MNIERYGRGGPAIVLLHGFGTCAFLWRNVAPELAVAYRTAYAMDLFGHGESDRPFDAHFGIAAQSAYVDAALTGLRVSRATVIGVDLGGAVAMHLAATHPERVDRLVLINPIALDQIPGDDIKGLQRNTGKLAFKVSRGTLGAAPLLRPLLQQSVAREEKMPESLVARYVAPYVGSEGLDHLLALARSVDADDMADVALDQLHQPTLIAWGDQDRFVSAKLAERLSATIPGSRLVHVPSAARLIPEEAPDALARMILDFVGTAVLT